LTLGHFESNERMTSPKTLPQLEDERSYSIDISSYDTKGFCTNYPLRRHKFEAEANAGSQDARKDWAKYIAPTNKFGGCNPINGNFTAVVLPFCRPERLRLVAYILECKQEALSGILDLLHGIDR
jgi:hypothetical protein